MIIFIIDVMITLYLNTGSLQNQMNQKEDQTNLRHENQAKSDCGTGEDGDNADDEGHLLLLGTEEQSQWDTYSTRNHHIIHCHTYNKWVGGYWCTVFNGFLFLSAYCFVMEH